MQILTTHMLAIGLAIAAAITADSAPLQEQDRAAETAPQDAPADLATLQKQLSAWKLRTRTDATWEDAGAELERLVEAIEAAALASPQDGPFRGFLSDAYSRAIQWTAQRGDVEATAERIVELRLLASERAKFPRKTMVLAAAMTLARADVKKIEKSLPEGAQRASLPAASSDAEDVVIARAVREAVARGDDGFLSKLGTKAVPALTGLVRIMDGSPIPEGEADPLEWIFKTDIAAGLDLTLTLLRRDEYLVLKSVQHRLALANVFGQREVWTAVGETDWRIVNPEWLEILRSLVAQEDAPNNEVATIVSAFAQHGAIPRDLGPTCVAILSAVDSVNIRPRVPASSGTWFYVDLLGSDSAKLRDKAVDVLLNSDSPNVVLALSHDPSVDVRKKIARVMRRFSANVWEDSARRSRPERVQRSFAIDSAYVGALRTFATDPNEQVRNQAISSALNLSTDREESVVDGPTLRELMAAGSDDVADPLLSMIRFLPAGERLPSMYAYINRLRASDLNAEFRDSRLVSMLNVGSFGVDPREGFWPVVQRIEAGAPDSEVVEDGVASAAINLIKHDELPTAEFIAWLQADMGASAWQRVLRDVLNARSFSATDSTWLGRARSAERAQLVRLVGDVKNPMRREGMTLEFLRHRVLGIQIADLVTLIEDDTAPWLSRSWAVVELISVAPAALTTDLVPTFAEVLGNTSEFIQVKRFARNPDAPDLALDILDAMLADPAVKDTWLADQELRLTRDSTVDLVLERFPTETWTRYPSSKLLKNLISVLVKRSVDRVDPRLVAANIPGSQLQGHLALEIGWTRSAVLFPLLAEILRDAPNYSDGYKNGLRAVTGYLNDEAAALLLETARRASTEELRTSVMVNLEQILAWQDAAARWEKGRDAAARRLTAIDELIAMADDADQPSAVRAEALRGLGLLGAAEELPRLVRALTDSDEAIRKAAREAIDRLHADDGQTEKDE